MSLSPVELYYQGIHSPCTDYFNPSSLINCVDFSLDYGTLYDPFSCMFSTDERIMEIMMHHGMIIIIVPPFQITLRTILMSFINPISLSYLWIRHPFMMFILRRNYQTLKIPSLLKFWLNLALMKIYMSVHLALQMRSTLINPYSRNS